MRSAIITVTAFTYVGIGMLTLANAQQLVLQPEIGKIFDALYGRVVEGKLDLGPVYAAANIMVSNQTCEPKASKNDPRACASAPCPASGPLGGSIMCLFDRRAGIDRSDLIVQRPYPVKRLGDYNPDWNSFQFKMLQTKLGGRLPPIGLVRTLATPGQERSGFFEFVRVEDTSDGGAIADRWRSLAKGGVEASCGETMCFAVYSVVPNPEGPSWSSLHEALVECVKRRVKNSAGSPEYCMPIFLRGSKGTFISALTSFRNEAMRVVRGLIGANIFFDSGTGKPNFEAVAGLVERALTAAPLALETSRDPDAIVGVSAMRPSRIIDNWQEMATVRAVMTEVPLAVSELGGATRNLVGIRVGVATTLYVNNRNTMDESEWRMPTTTQSTSFDTAIVATIKAEAAKQCPNSKAEVRNSVTIISCAARRW